MSLDALFSKDHVAAVWGAVRRGEAWSLMRRPLNGRGEDKMMVGGCGREMPSDPYEHWSWICSRIRVLGVGWG